MGAGRLLVVLSCGATLVLGVGPALSAPASPAGAGSYKEKLAYDPADSTASCGAYSYGPNHLSGAIALGDKTYIGPMSTSPGTLYLCDAGEGGWYESITPVTLSGSPALPTRVSANCSVTSYFVAVDRNRDVPLDCTGAVSGGPTESFHLVLHYPCTCRLYDTVGPPVVGTQGFGAGYFTIR